MITIVIPNFNGLGLLKRNLPNVLSAARDKQNNISEIVVVDDGSGDDSIPFLQKNYPSIKAIQHKTNKGFSVAVNTGVRASKTGLVCLLNTDVTPSSNFLYGIENYFRDENVFGVSLHERGYGPAVGKFEHGFVVHEPKQRTTKPTNTFWVNGGSGVFKRSIWDKLHGLDEQLYSPFYWEDIDLSYRAMKRGYKIFWVPEAMVIHKHESTVKKSTITLQKRNLIIERNQLLFIWKNITDIDLFRKHLLGLVIKIIQHPGYIKVVFVALRKTKDVLSRRKREQVESNVSDLNLLLVN